MNSVGYLLGPAACAIGMMVCMGLMAMATRRERPADADGGSEVVALRAEVAELRAAQGTASTEPFQ